MNAREAYKIAEESSQQYLLDGIKIALDRIRENAEQGFTSVRIDNLTLSQKSALEDLGYQTYPEDDGLRVSWEQAYS